MRESGSPPRLCARCGEAIGVYERIGVEDPQGRIRLSSWLNLDRDVQRDAPLYHTGCLADPDS